MSRDDDAPNVTRLRVIRGQRVSVMTPSQYKRRERLAKIFKSLATNAMAVSLFNLGAAIGSRVGDLAVNGAMAGVAMVTALVLVFCIRRLYR